MRLRQIPWFVRRSGVALVVAVLLGAAALASEVLLPETPVSGPARVVDGDTLRLNGERVRLLGIDAPELKQSCTDRAGAQWRCGEAARTRMAALLRAGPTVCAPQGHDRYGRILAHCRAGGADLGQSMVSAGLAVADGGYFAEEAAARNAHAGIWQGLFVPPAVWRREEGSKEEGGEGTPNILDMVRRWFH